MAILSTELQPLQESLSRGLLDMIRDAQDDLLQSFWATRQNGVPTVDMPSDIDVQGSSDLPPLASPTSEIASASQDLTSLFQQPPMSEINTNLASISQVHHPTVNRSSDSGYSSQNIPVYDSAPADPDQALFLSRTPNELDIPSEALDPQNELDSPTEELELQNDNTDINTLVSAFFNEASFDWDNMAEQSLLSDPIIPEHLPEQRPGI